MFTTLLVSSMKRRRSFDGIEKGRKLWFASIASDFKDAKERLDNFEIAKELLEDETTDVNLEMDIVQKRNCLLQISEEGNAEMMKLLLKRKDLDPTSVDINMNTALHIACQRGNLEVVKMLIDHGFKDDVRTLISEFI